MSVFSCCFLFVLFFGSCTPVSLAVYRVVISKGGILNVAPQFNHFVLIGGIVLKPRATDADSGNNGRVHLSIISGNEGNFFNLNTQSGEVTLLRSLDMETARLRHWNFTLVILAKDDGKPLLSSIATFKLKVKKLNDFFLYFWKHLLTWKL